MMGCFSARAMAIGLSAAICVLSLGCKGEEKPVTEGLVTVTGTVTLNGKPLTGGSIMFAPAKKNAKLRNPNSQIDAEGKYDLTWSTDEMGALPGAYTVVVIYMDGIVTEDGPPPKSLIPEKYNNVATSGLSATVKESGENVFDFDLTE